MDLRNARTLGGPDEDVDDVDQVVFDDASCLWRCQSQHRGQMYLRNAIGKLWHRIHRESQVQIQIDKGVVVGVFWLTSHCFLSLGVYYSQFRFAYIFSTNVYQGKLREKTSAWTGRIGDPRRGWTHAGKLGQETICVRSLDNDGTIKIFFLALWS